MPKKETIQVQLAAPNPNLSPATRFGNLVFVAARPADIPPLARSAGTSVNRLVTFSSASS